MKKLLHISANQLPHWDQVHHTHRIWNELAMAFDEYHLIGRSRDNRFQRLKKERQIMHLVPALGRRNRSFFLTSFYLFRIIRKEKITHLLCQSPIWGGFAAVLASLWFRIPLMVEIHGDVYFHYFSSPRFLERCLGKMALFTLRRATRVRSLSSRMTEWLNANGIVKNVVEIPNRVDVSLFNPPKLDYSQGKMIRLISIGRFVPQKGYSIAIESIRQLSDRYHIQASFIGGGPMLETWQKQAGKSAGIAFISWMDQRELIGHLRASDVYIQPSLPFLGEAMPRTILEAMAMGLPVIASDIAAIPGIIRNGENGLLVPPNDPDALARAIEELIQNRHLREFLGKNARKDAETKYEWNQLFKLYRKELLSMDYAHNTDLY